MLFSAYKSDSISPGLAPQRTQNHMVTPNKNASPIVRTSVYPHTTHALHTAGRHSRRHRHTQGQNKIGIIGLRNRHYWLVKSMVLESKKAYFGKQPNTSRKAEWCITRYWTVWCICHKIVTKGRKRCRNEFILLSLWPISNQITP